MTSPGWAGRAADLLDPPTLADTPEALARQIQGHRWRDRPHLSLLADTIADVCANAGRLIVDMPPRYGKSETVSRWTPCWYLDRWPDRRIILASHEQDFAIWWGRRARQTIETHPDQFNVCVSADLRAAGEWETTTGGGMLTRGIGGSITGRGAHLMVIDDPIKDFAQAHSTAVRNAHWNWWLSTARTRLEPGAAVIVVMTRWHEDDLVGRLLSSEHEGDPADWTVLRIPALGEGADIADQGVVADALGRPEGVPLRRPSTEETPAEAAVYLEQVRREVGPYIWNGMYQQRPSEPEGTILRRAWWQFYRRDGDLIVRGDGERLTVDQLRIVQSWDMSFKDSGSSSYVVGQVWGVHGADRYLLEQQRDHLDFVATKRAVKSMRQRWPDTTSTWVEDKANGPAVIAELRREVSGLVPVNPGRDSKESRAWAVQGDLEAGNHHLPSPTHDPWVRDFIQECADFPHGAHDDQVDAYTQAMLKLRTGGPTRVRSPRNAQLNSMLGGR